MQQILRIFKANLKITFAKFLFFFFKIPFLETIDLGMTLL